MKCEICGQKEPHSAEVCELSMGFPFSDIEPEKCMACDLLSVVNGVCIECGATAQSDTKETRP